MLFQSRKTNIISNIHASYLAFKSCKEGLVLTITPLEIIKERYEISNIVWISKMSGYKNTVRPDALILK